MRIKSNIIWVCKQKFDLTFCYNSTLGLV